MVLSVTTSFYQGGAFPRERNRWHSSLRNIEQEGGNNWTDIWLSLQNPDSHWKKGTPCTCTYLEQRPGHSLQLKNIVVVLNPGKVSLFYSIHEPLFLGYVQGNDNFVSLTPLYLAYLYKVQCCIPPSHFPHDLVDMFAQALGVYRSLLATFVLLHTWLNRLPIRPN